jgi:hypothetical protein
MADTKISAMTAAALPLTGAELVPIVQSGANKKTTVADILDYSRSYGAWSDSTDQSGNVLSGTVVSFNTIDVADGITLVDNSKITVPSTGVYNLQFSIQFKNVANAQNDATIWLKINGSDLANSATKYTIPARKSASIFGYNVASLTFLLSLNSADYVQIFWLPDSTDVTIEHLPASVSPAYPAIPSIIASAIQVS